MASASDLLTQTEAAITACLTAQSYSVPGRMKAMAQLKELREFRKELLREIADGNEGSGSMCSLGLVEGAE